MILTPPNCTTPVTSCPYTTLFRSFNDRLKAMCNLYTDRKTAAEVAAHFGVDLAPAEFNRPEEVLPGYPGMVVREAEGRRTLDKMVWGFPLPQKSKRTG